eukprot:jgi/Bigna1/81180/fgenesh1_pg.78_\
MLNTYTKIPPRPLAPSRCESSLREGYGYDAERDFQSSRVDSKQNHDKRYFVTRRNHVFQLDSKGRMQKIMYNEVFRTPLQLPFDVFPKYIEALDKFVHLIHDDRFSISDDSQSDKYLILRFQDL